MPRAIILGAGTNELAVAANLMSRGIRPVILEPTGVIGDRISLSQYRRQPLLTQKASVIAELHMNQLIRSIYYVRDELCSVHTVNNVTGELRLFFADYFYSATPQQTISIALQDKTPHREPDNIQFSNLAVPL